MGGADRCMAHGAQRAPVGARRDSESLQTFSFETAEHVGADVQAKHDASHGRESSRRGVRGIRPGPRYYRGPACAGFGLLLWGTVSVVGAHTCTAAHTVPEERR